MRFCIIDPTTRQILAVYGAALKDAIYSRSYELESELGLPVKIIELEGDDWHVGMTATNPHSHYFNVSINMADSPTGMSTSEPTLSDAIASAIRNASYYAIECGYLPHFTITKECSECNGEGHVWKRTGKTARSKLAKRRCPSCKNKESTIVICEDVPFELHPNTGGEFNGKLTSLDLSATAAN